MKKLVLNGGLAGLFASIATNAFASICPAGPGCVKVPEISALDGAAALSVLVAVVALVWERRRRAA